MTGDVCQARYRASEVKILAPCKSGAEGQEKDKGVVASRGLKESLLKGAYKPQPVQSHHTDQPVEG